MKNRTITKAAVHHPECIYNKVENSLECNCGVKRRKEIAQELGRLGGEKTAYLYGKGYFSKIAKGWPKGKKRKPIVVE